jgi:hypothetical protein
VECRQFPNHLLVATIRSVMFERLLIRIFVAGEAGERHIDPVREDLVGGVARLLTDVVERISDLFAMFAIEKCRH